jgi:hypothetical protein
VDLKELEKEIREREMDNDLASLFIIRYLLSPPDPDMLGLGGKRDIFRRFKKFLEKKGSVPRQLELIFDVAFTFLEQEKKIIGVAESELGNQVAVLNLDEEIEDYNKEEIARLAHMCTDIFAKPFHSSGLEIDKEFFDQNSGVPWVKDILDAQSIRDSKDFPEESTYKGLMDFLRGYLDKTQSFNRIRKFSPDYFKEMPVDWHEVVKSNESEGEKDEEDLDNKWFEKLSKNDRNKLHITQMLEDVELQLRQLLRWKDFKASKAEVPKDILKDLIGKGGKIDQKVETTLKMTSGKPKILSFRDQFLNATTLGQLIEIILYRKKNFVDVFQDDSSFKRTEVMLKEIKSLRDPRAHVDQSFEWTDEMVNKTKTFTMEIITPILQWFDR